MLTYNVIFYSKTKLGFGSPCHPSPPRPPPPPWHLGWTWWWPPGAPGGHTAAVYSLRRSDQKCQRCPKTSVQSLQYFNFNCLEFRVYHTNSDKFEKNRMKKEPGNLDRDPETGSMRESMAPWFSCPGQRLQAELIKHDVSKMKIRILEPALWWCVWCVHRTLHSAALIKWKHLCKQKQLLCGYYLIISPQVNQ